jgi:polar amino acid transport system substrate-binding protein
VRYHINLPAGNADKGLEMNQGITRMVKHLPALCVGIATLTAALLSVGVAQADTLSKVQAAGTLVVITDMQFPPFDFMDQGVYKGFDKDVLDEVGKELHVKMEYRDFPWSGTLAGLDAGKFDFVGAPINATKARMDRYAFSAPFAASGNAFLTRADNHDINKPEDVAGKKVGVIKAGASAKQLATYSTTLPKPVDIREYADMDQVFADVASGRLDAGASSLPNVSYAAVKRPNTYRVVKPGFGVPTYYGWITRKDDPSLINAVSAALLKMEADGRMAAIQKKWFGATEALPKTMPEPQS